ncbi:amidohydrolase family protein, partial [Vibrio parahaemolyticus VPTS-2010]
SITTR